MRNATTTTPKIEQLDEGDWLNQLLAEIQAEIARQPSASVVARIRTRLLARIDRPERAAA